MSRQNDPVNSSRRALLAGAGAAGMAGVLAGGATASAQEEGERISVARNGRYETAELRQSAINVTAIQSRVKSVDIRNLRRTNNDNLAHVLKLIDQAQGSAEEWGGERLWGSKQDFLCMHEFPIQGWQPWNRSELQRIAYELPGPESEAIGERAKRYDCYISWGAYVRDPDWPGHILNLSILTGPDGSIVAKQWKARNALGLFGNFALIGTTVYDVLDRYVEMYGWDEVLPVARTDIGNIALTAVGLEPILYQCLALKGAEILVMTVTGGSNAQSAIATARANRIYTVGVGNSVSADNIGFAEAAGVRGDGTVIVDPTGRTLAQTANHHEDFAGTRIPIADFRETRRFPEIPVAILLPVLQQYQPTFQPNGFMERLPETYRDAAELVRERMSGG
jgi:predicted amidohydrolase